MCNREKSVKTSSRGEDNRRILLFLLALEMFSMVVVDDDECGTPEFVVALEVELEELEPFCTMVIMWGDGERGRLLTFDLFADAFPMGDEDSGEDNDDVTVLFGADEDCALIDAAEASRVCSC